MTNPTSNFGWQMPTNTDLVTDLPADFEVFGQAVDTSMADLLGGTTGQILAKTSATNMDFTWINNDQGDITGVTAGTGITVTSPTGPVPTVSIDTATTVDKTTSQTLTNKTLTSPVLTTPSISNINAKGDILVGTADNTLGIITAGNNGETLIADSSTSTGLRYSATPSASNPVLNSAFQIWQRGTSVAITSANTYTADRYIASANTSGAGTVSQQVTGDTTNLPSIQYCARFQRNNANTATGIHYFVQPIETINSIPFVGKTVTLSFYARKGANYSATANALVANLFSGTGTDQSYLVAWTGGATVATTTATLTSTWQRFTISGTVATSATQLAISFQFTPTGTAGAADYYEVTGVQIDVGSVALPFRTYAATIQGELAACQRYYEIGTSGYVGDARLSGIKYGAWSQFAVAKRTAPTVTATSTAASGFNGTGVASDIYVNGFITAQNSSGVAGGTVYFFNSFTASAEL